MDYRALLRESVRFLREQRKQERSIVLDYNSYASATQL